MNKSDLQLVKCYETESMAHKLSILACLAFAIYIFFAIFSLRCLYADGSFQFTETLKAGDFALESENRYGAWFVEQLPAVSLIKLGLHNLYFLQLAFGVGCFLPWAISMLFCHLMAPRHFWLVMLASAAGQLNAAFMAVGECNITHACFWPVLFAVLFVRPLTPLAAGMMIISALILVFSYESMFFLGPPLAVLAAQRAWVRNEKNWARIALASSAALLLLGAWVALNSILYPQYPGNLGGFKHGLKVMLFHPAWTVGWTFVWIMLMIVACLTHQRFAGSYLKLKLSLLAAATAVWGFWPIFDLNHLRPDRQYDDRSLQLLVPLALLVVAWVMTRRPKWFESCRHYLVAFSAALLLAQSLWQITATWQWNGFVGIWRGVLASRSGPVSLSGTTLGITALQGQYLKFDWWWANPTLSIMLAPQGRVRSVIVAPDWTIWQPFNPLEPTDLPKLQRYGIDYSDYTIAVQKLKDAGSEKLPARQFFHRPAYSVPQ
jgi:hypothetical protein